MLGILGKAVIGGKPSALIPQQTHFDGVTEKTTLRSSRNQDREFYVQRKDCLREEYFLSEE